MQWTLAMEASASVGNAANRRRQCGARRCDDGHRRVPRDGDYRGAVVLDHLAHPEIVSFFEITYWH
eukprot:6210381-Pleurochrysis_carterae.AAC.1